MFAFPTHTVSIIIVPNTTTALEIKYVKEAGLIFGFGILSYLGYPESISPRGIPLWIGLAIWWPSFPWNSSTRNSREIKTQNDSKTEFHFSLYKHTNKHFCSKDKVNRRSGDSDIRVPRKKRRVPRKISLELEGSRFSQNWTLKKSPIP